MILQLEISGRIRTVQLESGSSAQQYQVTLDGQPLAVDAYLLRPGVLSIIVENRAYRIVLEDHPDELLVHLSEERHPYRVEDPRSLKARRTHAQGHDGPRPIKASMPGRVVRLLALAGESVDANQGVIVIEAMKMQNELKSPKDGRVAELRVHPGDTVAAGEVLAVID